jgi:F0F1-type ATP synthase membrane subunit c/vacuolar-type H+-ATPase subunit K
LLIWIAAREKPGAGVGVSVGAIVGGIDVGVLVGSPVEVIAAETVALIDWAVR